MAKNTIHALIVDDEALARRGLRQRLKALPGIQVVGEARNAGEALEKIRELSPHLVFLDVQMPGMTGFDLVRKLEDGSLPAVVFVTAYDEYAVRAFEVNAVDYLLKPVENDRLAAAVDRVRDRLGRQQAIPRHFLLQFLGDITGERNENMRDLENRGSEQAGAAELAKLAIKDGGKTTWVRQQDIEYIEAAGDYMCVHAQGQTHIMRNTMKALEEKLNAEFLQRIHRSTIVNMREVMEMQSHINGEYFLRLRSGQTVKLSRTYKSKLKHLHRTQP